MFVSGSVSCTALTQCGEWARPNLVDLKHVLAEYAMMTELDFYTDMGPLFDHIHD